MSRGDSTNRDVRRQAAISRLEKQLADAKSQDKRTALGELIAKTRANLGKGTSAKTKVKSTN